MYLRKNWYFRWENFIINSTIILLYLNIRHSVLLIDNLIIILLVTLLSFKKISIENKGLRVNNILYKWEDFQGIKGDQKKVRIFYQKYFFISSLKLSEKYLDVIRRNIQIEKNLWLIKFIQISVNKSKKQSLDCFLHNNI